MNELDYSWTKLTQDEFGRKGAKQNFALALIVIMFAGVFAFILPAPAAADSWTDTTTENFALGTHENTENMDDNVRLENIGVGIYYTQGRFTSQAFDAGQVVDNWDNISWSVTTPSLTKRENDNVGAEPDPLIDENSRIGTVAGGSLTDTRDNDGVYENIQENNIGPPTTVPHYEAATVVVSGDNLSSPDKLDADDGDNYQVSAGASVENTDYAVGLEPTTLVDGENSRIGVIAGGSITNVQTQNNIYENIQENNLGTLTTTQENAAYTENVKGENLSTPDKLNADDGDNYRVDAAYIPGAIDNTYADLPAGSNILGAPNQTYETVGKLDEVHSEGYDESAISGTIASVKMYIVYYGTVSGTLEYDVSLDGGTWGADTGTLTEGGSAGSPLTFSKDITSLRASWSLSDLDQTWVKFFNNDTAGPESAFVDAIFLEVQTTGTYALEIQHDSAAFTIPTGSTIENVRVRLNFGSDNTATYTLEIYDWNTPEWDILNSGIVANGTEVAWDNTLTTDPDNYISSNDNIRVRLRTDSIENDHISKEDYLQYYVGYTPIEYGLRWEHRVTGLPTNGTAYYVRIYGYADAGENFGIYTWNGANNQWVYSGENLPSGAVAETWVEYSISPTYLEGDNLSIMYLSADNTDETPENTHIDYAGVRATTSTYSLEVQHDSAAFSIPGGSTIDNVGILLNFASDNTATYTLEIYDWQNSEWDLVNSGSVGTIEVTWDNTGVNSLTTDPDNYLSTNDNIRVRLRTGAQASDHILQEDYLKFYVTYTPVDYGLRWGHRIENVATGFDNYIVKVRGYTSGDGENVGVYLWKSSTSSWEFIDNLDNIGPKTVTKSIAGSSISDYSVGDNLHVKYEDWDNTDDTQTTLHIDLCIVEQQVFFETGIKLQVRVSADGTTWTENLGPSGTSSDYFVSQSEQNAVGLENIPDNRYIQYIAYFSSEDSTITPVLHEVTINYTPRPPTKPVLYLPENGSQISDNTPYFEWTAGAGATYHRLQIDNDSNFSSPIYDNSNLGGNENSIEIENELPPDNYWWRVAAGNVRGENWSENTWTFEVLEVINHAPTAPSSPWCEGATNPTGVIDLTPEFSAIYEDPDAEDQAIYYEIEVNTQSDFLGTSMWDTGKTSMSPLTAGNRSADVGYAGGPLSLDGYQYFWRIRFWDDDNAQGAWSATQNFTMKDETPPSVPTDLSVVTKAGAEGTLVITWTAPTEGDLQGYKLWFSEDNSVWALETTLGLEISYEDTGLTDGENYFYKISAFDEIPNYSDNTAPVEGIPQDQKAPSVPTGLTVVDETSAEGSLMISWNATGGDTAGYQLWFSTDNITFTLEYDGALTSYTDTGLTDGSTYYYKVSAYDEVPNYSDNCAVVSGVPVDDLAPSIPTGLTVVDETGAEGSLVISWNATGGDTVGYQLWFSTDNITFTLESDQAGTTYTHTGLTDGSTYYYKVSSYDEVPNYSDNCAVVSGVPVDDLAPSVPTDLSVVTKAGAEGTLVITWTAPTEGDLQGYKLWFSEDNSVWALEDTLGLEISYEDTGLTDGENYFYKISAFDEVPNYSDNTAPVEGIPQDQKAPSVPTDLTVSTKAGAEGTLVITWTAPTEGDLQGYKLWFSEDNSIWALETTLGLDISYEDIELTDGENYFYKISAFDEVPNYSDNTAPVEGIPQDQKAPSVPTDLTVTDVGTGENLDLSWNANPELDLVGYKIYRATISGGPYSLIATVGVITSYRDNGLTTETTYYYVISAYDEVPNYSDNCTEASGTPTIGVPTSSVDAISYYQTVVPFTITATASDPDGYVDNVTLWYNWSSDNTTWQTWTEFGTDVDNIDGWSWSFNAPKGDNFYKFYTIARDDAGNVEGPPADADVWCDVDTTAPSVPTGLTVTDEAGVEGSLVISWNATGGDTQGYRLYFSSDGTNYTLEVDQAGTTYTDTGLTDGQTYWYKVSAYDEVPNYSDNCTAVSGVPVDDLAPSVPTDLSVATKAGAEGTLVITWTAPTEGDLQGYKLWFSEDNSVWTLEDTLGLENSYEDTGLTDGENYYYKISAFDEAPNYSDNTAPVEGIPQDQKAPSVPTDFSVVTKADDEGVLMITWTAPPEGDLQGYKLWFSEDNSVWTLEDTLGLDISYEDIGLTDGENYFYKISAFDEVPNYSDNTAPVEGIPQDQKTPSVPTDLTVSDLGIGDKLELNWNANPEPDLVGYKIYRFTISGGPYSLIATVGLVTSYQDNGLITGTTYYYVITAFDEVLNNSEYSAEASGTPTIGVPTSSVDAISYYQTVVPFTITATASDPDGYVENVTLWYNWSSDNTTWQTWTEFGTDVDNIDGWSWSFNAPKGDNFYKFYTIARDDVGNVEAAPADADVWCDVDTAAPPVPIGLMVVDETGAEGSLMISWNATGGDTAGYQLWFSTDNITFTLEYDGALTSYTHTGLTDGSTYYYKVSSYDEVPNYSDNCAVVSGVPLDDLAPSVPTGLTVTDEAGAEGSLMISWNATGGDTQGYHLYFSSDGINYTLEVDQAGTTYTHTGLTDGQTYWYKVSAYDEVPNYSDNCTAVSGVPLDDLAPSVPTGLSVATKAGAEGTLVITWTAPTEGDLQGYKLWFSEDNSVWTLETTLGLENSYEDTGLTDGENYYYKISAFDEAPNYSDNTAPVEGIPQDQKAPSAPTGLTVTNVETGENLDLSWTAPLEPDLTGYKIYRSTTSGGPYSLIATVGKITSYRDNGLITGTTYYYVTSAFDEVPNYSDNCAEASGTPTVGVPSSSVNEITPYYQTSTPFTITAIASPAAENVMLYYRYASDNDNWGPWASFGVDTESPWSWSFTADNGDGYYEFYSIAVGIAGQESVPAEADARCGVDTVAPTITSIVINDNADLTSSTSVTIIITASDATSGLAEVRFSDDNLSWSDWENFAASKSYTLPTGDGLKTVHVKVKDNAELVSTVASDSITLETIPPPPEAALTVTIGTITAGRTGSADFTQYAIAVTEVRITAAGTVSNVRVDVVVHATKPTGVTAIALPVYSYLDITTTIGAAEVREATIGFRVSRSWIAQNSIDERTIRLLRYGGGWQALSTGLVGADSTHVYFEATTPGFSLFVVTGERRAVPPVVTPPTAPTPPPAPLPASPAVPFEFFAMLSMVGALAGFSIAYSLARPSKYYLMLKRLERAVVRPRRRHVGEPAVRPPVRVRKQVSRAELAALRRLERIARKRKRKVRREGRKKSASERRR